MIREAECQQIAAFPIESIEKRGQIAVSAVVNHLLKTLKATRAEELFGYFLSVTKLISIGDPKPTPKFVMVPVRFCLRSFLPTAGETLLGTVSRVIRTGVFLRCGPMSCIYLHPLKMPGFKFVDKDEAENQRKPCFQRFDLSRIEEGVVVCFRVIAARWVEDGGIVKRDFQVLASIDGDSLGPVSMAGSEGVDFAFSSLGSFYGTLVV